MILHLSPSFLPSIFPPFHFSAYRLQPAIATRATRRMQMSEKWREMANAIVQVFLLSEYHCLKQQHAGEAQPFGGKKNTKTQFVYFIPNLTEFVQMEASLALAIHHALHNWRDVEGEVDMGEGQMVRFFVSSNQCRTAEYLGLLVLLLFCFFDLVFGFCRQITFESYPDLQT